MEQTLTPPKTTRKLKLSKTSVGINWELAFETEGDDAHAKAVLQEMIGLAAQGVADATTDIDNESLAPKKKRF